MLRESREQFNAKWRKYTCLEHQGSYEVFTVSPIPPDQRICGECRREIIRKKYMEVN